MKKIKETHHFFTVKTVVVYAQDSEGKIDYKGCFPPLRAESLVCCGYDDQATIQKGLNMLAKDKLGDVE